MTKKKVKEFVARTSQSRASVDIQFQCYGTPELFLPWEDMPEEARQEFKRHGPIPCEGGGMPGSWCEDCRFGKVETLDVEVTS